MKIFAKRSVSLCLTSLLLTQILSSQVARDELAAYNDLPSGLRGVIEKYDEDYGILNRFYSASTSPNRSARFKQLYSDELTRLAVLNFDSLNHDEQVDYILFKNYLEHEQKEQSRYDAQLVEMASLIPFSRTISDMEDDARRTLKDLDPGKAAATLNELGKQVAATQKIFEDASTLKTKTHGGKSRGSNRGRTSKYSEAVVRLL